MIMHLDGRMLQRYDPRTQRAVHAADEKQRPPLNTDVLLLGAGNSGETVALRTQALGYTDGSYCSAGGINNDRLAPRPLTVRQPDGSPGILELEQRLVLDGDNPRDQMQEYPLLVERYTALLRGIPVFETYPKAGAGGHGYPVISALDIDLHTGEVVALLRRLIRRLHDTLPPQPGQSDVQRLIQQHQQQQDDTSRDKYVVVIGGAAGAMGNAAHQLLPGLIRLILAEQGITNYHLWGVLLGPRAFSGLTPFVRHNYRALLEGLEHLSRVGQQRHYLHDVTVHLHQPPYDRVFVLDDPMLPGSGARVTEAELEGFFNQAALSLALLLRGTVWSTIASHSANDDGVPRDDGRLRYLHTVRGVLAGADQAQIADLLTASIGERLVAQFLQRFDQ
jgi:hypothetical protein